MIKDKKFNEDVTYIPPKLPRTVMTFLKSLPNHEILINESGNPIIVKPSSAALNRLALVVKEIDKLRSDLDLDSDRISLLSVCRKPSLLLRILHRGYERLTFKEIKEKFIIDAKMQALEELKTRILRLYPEAQNIGLKAVKAKPTTYFKTRGGFIALVAGIAPHNMNTGDDRDAVGWIIRDELNNRLWPCPVITWRYNGMYEPFGCESKYDLIEELPNFSDKLRTYN